MAANVERYRKDLDDLIRKGELLLYAMIAECDSNRFEKISEGKDIPESLPSFKAEYQNWYSESMEVIKLFLNNRLDDFIDYYKVPQSRENVNKLTYRIEDYLISLHNRSGRMGIASPGDAIDKFDQQLAILKSVPQRFESSLYNLRQLVQADLLDSEIDSAREFLENGHLSAAGVVAGLALEKHLAETVERHGVNIDKRKRTIGNLNNLLKDNGVLQTADWRAIQRLSDIRNMCAHSSDPEPTKEQVLELIEGVAKFTKVLS